MRTIITILVMVLTNALYAQDTPSATNTSHLDIIHNFINDIANSESRSDVILNKHVWLSDSLDNDMYDYLEASIEEIKLNLSTKNIDEIQYISFQQLPRKETRDIDPEGKPTENMYFLKYKGRQMLAIYIVDNRIASFTLVSKGNRVAHFVTY